MRGGARRRADGARHPSTGPIVTDVFGGADALGDGRGAALDGTRRGRPHGGGVLRDRPGAQTGTSSSRRAGCSRRLPQNLVYADVEGHIGYAAAGAMPIRPRADGLLPVSGTGEDDWTG